MLYPLPFITCINFCKGDQFKIKLALRYATAFSNFRRFSQIFLLCCFCFIFISLLLPISASESSAPQILTDAIYFALLNKEQPLRELLKTYTSQELVKNDLLLLTLALSANKNDYHNLSTFTKKISEYNPSAELKQLARYLLAETELQQIKKLQKQILYQKSTSIFNNLSSATSELVSGNTAFLGELGINTVYFLLHSPSVIDRERKLNFLLKQAMKKNLKLPSKTVNKFQKKMERLSQKQHLLEIERNLRRVDFYYRNGDFSTASFYLTQGNQHSQLITDISLRHKKINRLTTWRWKLANLEGQQQRLWLADCSITSNISYDQDNINNLIRSLLAGNEQKFFLARAQVKRSQPSEAQNHLMLSDSAWSFYRNQWQKGKRQLYEITRKFRSQPVARLSRGLLQSYSLNPVIKYDRQKRKYLTELWDYILTGQRALDEQAFIATSITVHNAKNFASNLGIFVVFDVLIRGVQSLYSVPVDIGAAKSAAVEYVNLANFRKENNAEVKKATVWLAKVYHRQRQFELARKYYAMANLLTDQLDTRLAQQSADELLRLALTQDDLVLKKTLLSSILEHYPESKASKKAQLELKRVLKEENTLCRLDYAQLQQNPIITETLNIQPELLDGKKSNGEISREGITVYKNSSFSFKDKNTGLELSVAIDEKNFTQFCGIWSEINNRKQSLEAINNALISRKFPVEVTGSAGSSGIEAYPRLQPLPPDSSLYLFK
ncbi:MAG: hypothetical protein N2246_04290 [Candidatus Sumerlaeia bacterium]|nr:hypothetical protein [Candidatus Sumerlaeia bacterium]